MNDICNINERDLKFINIRQIIIRAISVALFTAIVVWMFYQTALEQQMKRLVEIAQSRAALIHAMAVHAESHYTNKSSVLAQKETLKQLRNAQRGFLGIGKTGEFALAQLKGDQINFLLNHRHGNLGMPAPIPMKHNFAEPMRRAINGKAGTIKGLDYRGELVLAAYQPIPQLGWGIVAKIDLDEIRAPYINAGIIAVILAALIVSVSAFLALRSMRPFINAIVCSNERFREMAYHDTLTKLPNRLLFEEHCDQALIRARRKSTKLAVLFLDLNRFKQINDEFGHAIGDQLLLLVASRLNDGVREMDLVARLAGDEFIILMEEFTHLHDIEAVAKNLLKELSLPFDIQGYNIQLSGSVGISLFPENGNSKEDLMKSADAAMYKAKNSGEGNYVFSN